MLSGKQSDEPNAVLDPVSYTHLGKDIDAVVDWIERIPYTETRSYVQRVMENYEVYKMRISGKYDIVGDLVNGRK